MNEMERHFNQAFDQWNIRLPEEDVAHRRRGKIVQGGWAIWYLFGADENGEYLDYYAAHRMTCDQHVRIYANGEEKGLPAINDFRAASKDPIEDERLEKEFFEENQRISELLEAKGFGMQGNEPGGVQINRYLKTNPDKDK